MSEPDRVLTTLTRTQGANQALKDGTVTPAGFSLKFEEIPVLVKGFRRMVRSLEFDVSEMALTTYLTAREHGVAFTALPVFLVRGFHHGAIRYNTRSSIRHPKDLEGRRVGVNRGYTVTTGVWARGILATEYGVDLGRVTWVLSGDEHVESYVPPANVVPARPGADLAEMLISGEIDAVIGVDVDHPDVAPLIGDPEEAAITALRQRGFYPINHLVVVKDEVLAPVSGGRVGGVRRIRRSQAPICGPAARWRRVQRYGSDVFPGAADHRHRPPPLRHRAQPPDARTAHGVCARTADSDPAGRYRRGVRRLSADGLRDNQVAQGNGAVAPPRRRSSSPG